MHEFTAGQSVIWNPDHAKFLSSLIGKYGAGPFEVLKVIAINHTCNCRRSNGRHGDDCDYAVNRLVSYSQKIIFCAKDGPEIWCANIWLIPA